MCDNDSIEVSVVCLTYNHERYIEKMLESVVSQKTTFKYEILIHDDASTDATQKVIEKYTRRFPKLIKPILQTENQYSKGINPQVTYNLPRVRGKYVAFCEGDDYWTDPMKLQRQYEMMEDHRNCSICVHQTQCILPDGSQMKKKFPPVNIKENIISKQYYLESELHNSLWLFQTSSYFIRSDIIRDYIIKYKNRYPVGDMPMVFYALQYGPCYYIPVVMSCYRTQSGGFVTGLNSCTKRIQYHRKMIEGHCNFDKQTNYIDHDLFEYAIRNNEVAILLLENKYKDIFLPRYKEVRMRMSAKRKAIIVLGAFLPKQAEKLERVRHGWRK